MIEERSSRPDLVGTGEPWGPELTEKILAGMSLSQVITTLRELRRQGVERQEVQHFLQAMRERTADESVEDRILEVMDVVSGFCSREHSVWD